MWDDGCALCELRLRVFSLEKKKKLAGEQTKNSNVAAGFAGRARGPSRLDVLGRRQVSQVKRRGPRRRSLSEKTISGPANSANISSVGKKSQNYTQRVYLSQECEQVFAEERGSTSWCWYELHGAHTRRWFDVFKQARQPKCFSCTR